MAGSSLVSIIIPTHDRKNYLAEAVNSVSRQTYEHWEIIVVDDASEDGTSQWLEEKASEQFRWLRLPGKSGSTVTRNAGFRLARGEYCLFLDDDDLLPKDALELHVDAIRGLPAPIATLGAVYAFDENGFLTRLRPAATRKPHDHIWRDIQFWWAFMVGASLFRASVIEKVGGFDESLAFYGDDVDLWLRIGHLGPVVLLPNDVIKWRHHGQKRPDDFYEFLTEIGNRHAKAWSPQRRATAQRILQARSALYDLRLNSGKPGNVVRLTRLLTKALLCPYLLMSPLSTGEIRRAVHRDLRMDPWRRRIKKMLR